MVCFTTRRSDPELVAPSRPTPRETKILSDLDDLQNHHEYTAGISFFRSAGGGMPPKDTAAKAMRAALTEALVYYYPVAGRLRELPGGKLAVECNEEGVVFVAAEADVRLQDLGLPLVPPFPCDGELVCSDVGDVGVILGKPLFFMQVTQFKCGGFALGLHMIHCIADGFGWNQFMKAVADLARGEPAPLVLPVWQRELLTARSPASAAAAYRAFRPLVEGSGIHNVLQSTPLQGMACRCFLFGRAEMAVLRSHVPAHLRRRCTDFDMLTAVTWCCRTAAVSYDPSQKVYLYFPSSAHGGRWSAGLLRVPEGYYDNALVYTIIEAAAGELCAGGRGLRRAAKVMLEGKSGLTPKYARSTVDLVVSLHGRRLLFDGVFFVSDVTNFAGASLDFGWGEWVGSGIVGPKLASFHMRCKDADGEESVAVSMLLPDMMMERFEDELAMWLNNACKIRGRRSAL